MRPNLRHPDSFESNIEKLSQRLNVTEDFVDNAVFLTKYPTYFPVGTLRRPANSLSQAIDFAQGDSVIVVYPGYYALEGVVNIPSELRSLKIVGVGFKEDIILPPINIVSDGAGFRLELENLAFISNDDDYTIKASDHVELILKNVSVFNDFNKAVSTQNKSTIIEKCLIEGVISSLNTEPLSSIKIIDTILYYYGSSQLNTDINNKNFYAFNLTSEQNIELNSNNMSIYNSNLSGSLSVVIGGNLSLINSDVLGDISASGGEVLKSNCKISGNYSVNSNFATLKSVDVTGICDLNCLSLLDINDLKANNILEINSPKVYISNSFLNSGLNLNSTENCIVKGVLLTGNSNISCNKIKIYDSNFNGFINAASENFESNHLNITGNLIIDSINCKLYDASVGGNLILDSENSFISNFISDGNSTIESTNLRVNDSKFSGSVLLNSNNGQISNILLESNLTLQNSNLIIDSISFKRGSNIQSSSIVQTGGTIYLNNAYFEKSEVDYMLNNNISIFSIDGASAKIYFGSHNLSSGTGYIVKTNGAESDDIRFGQIS